MTRSECWCRQHNAGTAIPTCLMCGGKGYVDNAERDPAACSICDFVPTKDDFGVMVSHWPSCPRAKTDPPLVVPASEPDYPEAPSEPMGLAEDVEPASTPPEPAERTEPPEEVDEGPSAPEEAFAAGMAGSAASADAKWSDEQKVAVRVAVRYAALHNAEFTTDEVWARLRDIDPDFPSSKGMAGVLTAMTEHDGGSNKAKMVGPGSGSGLTRSGKPATMRSTGRTRKPQREDMNNGQRLAIYESLIHDPGLCPGALRGPIPPDVVGKSDRHRKPGDRLLVRCSKCMEPVDVVIYQRQPFLAEHRRGGEHKEDVA